MKLATSWLDLKLSLRMLTKYPFVTLIACVATAFAIGASALYFEIVSDLLNPKLPLDEGDRVVEVRNQDLATTEAEPRSLHDYVAWRDELKTVRDLGAFTLTTRNVGTSRGDAEPVQVVEISASAFRTARIPPLLGRPLVAADEEEGAAPVVVLGERLWAARFNRDRAIVGKQVLVGGAPARVVGVMPKTFALPGNQEIWVPFRANPLSHPRGQGPAIRTIGRLAPGVTLEQAQAEVTVIGRRLSAEFPATNQRLRPTVAPYLEQFTPGSTEATVRMGINAIFMILLIVICANVGALVFARIVAREKEFSVRTALGASRGRIVAQLFVEALLLTSIGAAVALLTVAWGLKKGEAFLQNTTGDAPPFWHDSTLNPTTILYVVVLAILGAVFMGVLPALKFTRGSIEASMRRSAAGGSGMRSRRMSTAVIVAQVALSGALLPIAVSGTMRMNWSDPERPGIRAGEYLTVRYGVEDSVGGPATGAEARKAARTEAVLREMRARVLADPGFAGVTFAHELPGSKHPQRRIEVKEEGSAAAPALRDVRVGSVGADYFDTFRTPVLAGRGFRSSDAESDLPVVVVNQPFVQSVLGGRNAIGRQVRFATAAGEEPGRWYEIVGVVPDLAMNPAQPHRSAGIYRLAPPEDMGSGYMAVRVAGSTDGAAQRFRTLASEVDEGLLLYEARFLDKVVDPELRMDRAFALMMVGGCLFIVLLSAAVTFALMSFTVSQRMREIGIYRALGASSRAILVAVFSRAFLQLGLGAGLGAAVIIGFSAVASGTFIDIGMLMAIIGSMLLVGLVSCGAPALRALRIEPTVAMKEEV
ncbi:MAG TPA: ABC transporter permease [Longimicrobium sp.]|nr:ABC transporter permease [Longimicrobium sp.]